MRSAPSYCFYWLFYIYTTYPNYPNLFIILYIKVVPRIGVCMERILILEENVEYLGCVYKLLFLKHFFNPKVRKVIPHCWDLGLVFRELT